MLSRVIIITTTVRVIITLTVVVIIKRCNEAVMARDLVVVMVKWRICTNRL